MTTRITRYGGVFFGDEELSGAIEEGSIVFRPAGGGHTCNRLTVTFLVGEVIAEDPSNDA
jgi:hypothetical protein